MGQTDRWIYTRPLLYAYHGQPQQFTDFNTFSRHAHQFMIHYYIENACKPVMLRVLFTPISSFIFTYLFFYIFTTNFDDP